jgi:hypothetical protein
MLRDQGQLIGLGGSVDMGDKGRMGSNILHSLPSVVDHVVQFLQAVDIIFFGLDHLQTPSLVTRCLLLVASCPPKPETRNKQPATIFSIISL